MKYLLLLTVLLGGCDSTLAYAPYTQKEKAYFAECEADRTNSWCRARIHDWREAARGVESSVAIQAIVCEPRQ